MFYKIIEYIKELRDEKGRLPIVLRMILLLIFLVLVFKINSK